MSFPRMDRIRGKGIFSVRNQAKNKQIYGKDYAYLLIKRLTHVCKTIKILYANYCENICKFFKEVIGTWQQNGFICSKKVTRQ